MKEDNKFVCHTSDLHEFVPFASRKSHRLLANDHVSGFMRISRRADHRSTEADSLADLGIGKK